MTTRIEIRSFASTERTLVEEAAALLLQAFPHSYAPMERAVEEVEDCLQDGRIALLALDGAQAAGFIGARPQYGTTGWELHPLVVAETSRGKGIGTALVQALEAAVAKRGGITLYLGSDDEFGKTSLSGCDLYESLHDRIRNIRNLLHHPYSFYEKAGFMIVGVIPDANGLGKPDILMAKRVGAKKPLTGLDARDTLPPTVK